RVSDGVAVAQVTDDELGLRVDESGHSALVSLGIQIVDDPDAMAATEQLVDEVRSDEPGAAGHQNAAHDSCTDLIRSPVPSTSARTRAAVRVQRRRWAARTRR